jgi:hypothetical protein
MLVFDLVEFAWRRVWIQPIESTDWEIRITAGWSARVISLGRNGRCSNQIEGSKFLTMDRTVNHSDPSPDRSHMVNPVFWARRVLHGIKTQMHAELPGRLLDTIPSDHEGQPPAFPIRCYCGIREEDRQLCSIGTF